MEDINNIANGKFMMILWMHRNKQIFLDTKISNKATPWPAVAQFYAFINLFLWCGGPGLGFGFATVCATPGAGSSAGGSYSW